MRRGRKASLFRHRAPVQTQTPDLLPSSDTVAPAASTLFEAAAVGHHLLLPNRFIDLCAAESSVRYLWSTLNKRRAVGRAVNPVRYCLYLTDAWLGPEQVEVATDSSFSLNAFSVCIWPLVVGKLHVGYLLKLPEPRPRIGARSLWPVFQVDPYLIKFRRATGLVERLRLDSEGTTLAYQDDAFSIITSVRNSSIAIIAGSLPMTIKGVTSWRGSQAQNDEPT